MFMLYTLLYHPKVKTEDIPRITLADRILICRAIEQRLIVDPIRYGMPLRWSLKGYRKLRVGDYRIIYYVCGEEIRIIMIGHRRDVYKISDKRIEK